MKQPLRSSPMSALMRILGLAGIVLTPHIGYATTITFEGVLSGANENPAVVTPATGLAIVTLDTTAATLEIDVTFADLSSPDTAAHIHCCVPFGGNTGVATAVPAFPGFPLGVTSGTYDSTFSLLDPTLYNPSFVTANGGLASAEAVFVAGLENDQTYLNIHTAAHPGGEVRAFLQPVPEPATVALLGTGLVVVARRRLRLRRG